MIAGVGLFGRNLIRITTAKARASQQESLAPEIRRNNSARLATKIFCCGVALQAFSIILALMLPSRL
jgi:hypothetical protein